MHDEHETDRSEATRLHLDGVDTPIVTRVTRRTERGMTVEQALPFLQLQTQVWGEAQRPSRIESVSVVVYDGMPRLVLDLAYDEHDDVRAERGVAEPRTASEPRRAHAGVVRSRARIDHTAPFEREALQLAAADALGSPSPRREGREATQTFALPVDRARQEEEAKRPLAPEVASMKLSQMELDLLQPKDWVYHTRLAWNRAQPHLKRFAAQALVISKQLAARALPALRRVLSQATRLAQAGLTRMRSARKPQISAQ